MWTLQQGIEFLRMAEHAAIKEGFHVALGGSVLHRGSSDKDLDVFVYPHKTVDGISMLCFIDAMNAAGVMDFRKADHTAYGDEKSVYRSEYQGKRIDWFFLK